MADLPVLIKTDPPKVIPSPFGTVEEFMLGLATMEGDGIRPHHFETLSEGDFIKGKMAIANGMNYLRHATDLGAAVSYSKLIEGVPIVLYRPTDAAATYWRESANEGKDAKQIYDGWAALKELMSTIKSETKAE